MREPHGEVERVEWHDRMSVCSPIFHLSAELSGDQTETVDIQSDSEGLPR